MIRFVCEADRVITCFDNRPSLSSAFYDLVILYLRTNYTEEWEKFSMCIDLSWYLCILGDPSWLKWGLNQFTSNWRRLVLQDRDKGAYCRETSENKAKCAYVPLIQHLADNIDDRYDIQCCCSCCFCCSCCCCCAIWCKKVIIITM